MKISIALLALLALGCSKAGNTALSSGSDRLVWENQPVNFDTTGGIGTSMSASGYSTSSVSVPLSLTQVAQLNPPSANSASLQAESVVFVGSKAYVGYNTQGTTTAGGIDVIDFTTPSNPTMTSQVVLPNVDINGLYALGLDLYAVGADANDNPAVLYDYPLTAGGAISGSPTTARLPGYAGTGVKADLLNVYAVSGDNAGLTILARTGLTQNSYTPIADARDISVDLTGVNVVTGKTSSTAAHVVRYSLLGLLNQTSADMAGATVQDGGKASIQSGTLLSVTTAGTGGTNLVCGVGGAISANIAIPTSVQFPNLTPDLRASNSAAFGNGLIYIANGAAGISVYTLELGGVTPSCLVTSSYVGRITFADGISVNNVAYSNGNLIVATGLGGFRIIQVTQGVSIGLQTTL